MRVEELREILEYLTSDDCTDTQAEYREELTEVIEELGTRIGRKPLGKHTNYSCPHCHKTR